MTPKQYALAYTRLVAELMAQDPTIQQMFEAPHDSVFQARWAAVLEAERQRIYGPMKTKQAASR